MQSVIGAPPVVRFTAAFADQIPGRQETLPSSSRPAA